MYYPPLCDYRRDATHHLLLRRSKRVMGIEPTYPAWKAGVLPLNYTRVYVKLCENRGDRIRTPDPRLRRPLLYPAELRTHAYTSYLVLKWMRLSNLRFHRMICFENQ